MAKSKVSFWETTVGKTVRAALKLIKATNKNKIVLIFLFVFKCYFKPKAAF